MKALRDTHALALVRYWRNSLVDEGRADVRALSDLSLNQSILDMQKGALSAATFRAARTKLRNHLKKGSSDRQPRDNESADLDSLPVLICPVRLSWAHRVDRSLYHAPRFLEALWIPAELRHDGTLYPLPGRLPWIPRALLEPAGTDAPVIVGSLEELETFLTKHPAGNNWDWDQYWKWTDALFQASTGSAIFDFGLEFYERRPEGLILLSANEGASQRLLVNKLDEVLEGIREPGLLKTVAGAPPSKRKFHRRTADDLRTSARLHSGQFTSKYPLSSSQRRAVHRTLELRDGQVLAVTGPPGTGKTTMLQSIIASLWINAALGGKDPAVILACAGTNQAVTNIIDSFSKALEDSSILARRWLPSVVQAGTVLELTYGCYCPSATRAKENERFLIERTEGGGLSQLMETPAYLKEARQHYAASGSAFFQRQANWKKIFHRVQRELKLEYARLCQQLSAVTRGRFLDFILSARAADKGQEYLQALSCLESADTKQRYRLFQLATHYWEGRWLDAVEVTLDKRERRLAAGKDSQVRTLTSRESWQRRAMVTPCFVSTFQTAPRFFAFERSERRPIVDLLIVDEAGQVTAPTAAACLALASRALIVGDVQQLEPVRGILPHIDRENLRRSGVLRKDTEREFEAFEKTGAAASSGSVMQLGLTHTSIEDESKGSGGTATVGVFLSEHRRCVPEIIQYCNDLAYGGRLHALRESMQQRVLPAFGYAHIPGVSLREGTSRRNDIEAAALAGWLEHRRGELEAFYAGRKLESIVAVVTPFAAQKRALERQLRADYPQMTIGTVHALQGAERPVVIFSSVYSGTDPTNYFFDRDTRMLNVAVSRAQDSFLVFGDMHVFDYRSAAPSGLLARYLFASDSNQIADVPVAMPKVPAGVDMTSLTTLSKHRETLRAALEMAQKELWIVSPTISIRAIEADEVTVLIREAVGRGVRIAVYFDKLLNASRDEGSGFSETAQAGIDALERAGAEMRCVAGVHSKELLVDELMLVRGSFNWLSAVRDERSRHHRLETSTLFFGGESTARMIRESREEIEFYRRVRSN